MEVTFNVWLEDFASSIKILLHLEKKFHIANLFADSFVIQHNLLAYRVLPDLVGKKGSRKAVPQVFIVATGRSGKIAEEKIPSQHDLHRVDSVDIHVFIEPLHFSKGLSELFHSFFFQSFPHHSRNILGRKLAVPQILGDLCGLFGKLVGCEFALGKGVEAVVLAWRIFACLVRFVVGHCLKIV